MQKASVFPGNVSAKDVALKMKIEYARGIKDQTTKSVEAACGLLWELEQKNLDLDAFLHEAADMIQRLFAIESVAIGVRDPVDKLYKYRAVVGLDKDVADGYKSLQYTREQLLEPSKYPSYEISKHTRVFLTEDHPYANGEEFTYRRPGLIGMKRRTVTDSLEADYLDFLFYDEEGDILGYIETSGTRLKKLPDSMTIRWLELFASVIGTAVQKKRAG